jgi:hypothetical protein
MTDLEERTVIGSSLGISGLVCLGVAYDTAQTCLDYSMRYGPEVTERLQTLFGMYALYGIAAGVVGSMFLAGAIYNWTKK